MIHYILHGVPPFWLYHTPLSGKKLLVFQLVMKKAWWCIIGGMELTVGKEYQTIQETLNAIPYDVPAIVHLPGGVYHEKLFSDHQDLTLVGSGEEETSIVFEEGARQIAPDGNQLGTFRSYTAFFSGERLVIRDLNISNFAGVGCKVGQAVALYLDVRHAHLSHVRLNGFQDTLFLAPLPEKEREPGGFRGPRAYAPRRKSEVVVEHSTIRGDIDFIFGGAEALFNDCDLVSLHPGYVAAPSGKQGERGFVFFQCRFTAEVAGCVDESVAIMRPWRPEGKVTTISCTFGPHIKRERVVHWPGLEQDPLHWDHWQLAAKDNTLTEKQVMALIGSFKV